MVNHDNFNVYAVLLAGGTGTRLWPVSRELYPKQLVTFSGRDSLVQRTVKRLTPVLNPEYIRIVCGQNHEFEIGRQMREIGLQPAGKLLPEPCGRNTAPAILLAVLNILTTEKDAVLAVFPADHDIRDEPGFQQKLRSAVQLALAGHIVTFGITPNYPETGYGYIEGGDSVSANAVKLKRFVEKPDTETAEHYLKSGRFYWNSGMFAFKASVIYAEFAKHHPGLLSALTAMTARNGQISESDYASLENISIDYAIMEKTDQGVILPSDFGWSDIGSWKSLYDFLPKDQNGNVIDGDVIAKETQGCFIMGHDRLIATNRLSNMAVISAGDSVFVSDLATSREVKTIVDDLKRYGRKEYRKHNTEQYPWGTYALLEAQVPYQTARLIIQVGERCEILTENSNVYLMIIMGKADIETVKGKQSFSAGESISLSGSSFAAVENTGNQALHLIQIRFNPMENI